MSEFKLIPVAPLYWINKEGIVKKHSGEIVNIRINKGGYKNASFKQVELNRFTNLLIHRILAQVFIPNPNNYKCVNHIDGNKQNNDLKNLEWCTGSQNTQHAHKTGLVDLSKRNHGAVIIPIIQYDALGNILNEFKTTTEAYKHSKCGHSEFKNILRNGVAHKDGSFYKYKNPSDLAVSLRLEGNKNKPAVIENIYSEVEEILSSGNVKESIAKLQRERNILYHRILRAPEKSIKKIDAEIKRKYINRKLRLIQSGLKLKNAA